MTRILTTAASLTCAALIAITGAPPINLTALQAYVATRPAFIAAGLRD